MAEEKTESETSMYPSVCEPSPVHSSCQRKAAINAPASCTQSVVTMTLE
jgi:hypothetical protein